MSRLTDKCRLMNIQFILHLWISSNICSIASTNDLHQSSLRLECVNNRWKMELLQPIINLKLPGTHFSIIINSTVEIYDTTVELSCHGRVEDSSRFILFIRKQSIIIVHWLLHCAIWSKNLSTSSFSKPLKLLNTYVCRLWTLQKHVRNF